MIEFIGFIVGLALGALIIYLVSKSKASKLQSMYDVAKEESARLQTATVDLQTTKEENAGLKVRVESLIDNHKREIELLHRSNGESIKNERQFNTVERESLLANHEKVVKALKEASEKEIILLRESFETERIGFQENRKLVQQNYEDSKVQMEKQWREKTELLKAEFQALANEVLESKSGNLQSNNKEQIDAILTPLKERIQTFETAVKNSQETNVANKASLEKAIEEVMKRTQEIGNDAVNLTKALKGNNKTQGDWGEMILENILEKSGLRKDEEYFIQENITSDGDKVRPDVIVRFPEQRSVIIDSKVSLTAYANYMECDDDRERAIYLKNHLKSIKDHIDELSNRNYSQYVEQSIGYVLMFIPNEASYILAVQHDPNIGSYAYNKRIVLISPTNLMMALQLAYNLWQSERQSMNVREIVRQGNDLYDKFVTFSDNFSKLDDQIAKLRSTYDETSKQLSEGKGNLVRRVENLRELGLNPKKRINSKLIDGNDGDEADRLIDSE